MRRSWKNVRDAGQRVAPERRHTSVDHSAIAFAAELRLVFQHLIDHVRFADRGTDKSAFAHERRALWLSIEVEEFVTLYPLGFCRRENCQRQRVFFTNRAAFFIDERKPVGVWVEKQNRCQPYACAPPLRVYRVPLPRVRVAAGKPVSLRGGWQTFSHRAA